MSAWPAELRLMQAPIGPAGTPELVHAVGRAGGLGTLAASWTRPDVLRATVRSLREGLDRPFCVNLVLAFDQRERLEAALDGGAPAVSFSWGIDPVLVDRAHRAGTTVMVQVGTPDEGRRAEQAGADFVIGQGVEAGGHVQSTTPLMELLPALRDALSVPVVAAGGIADPEDVRAALSAGAHAVACGTVFLAAREADVHPRYRAALLAAGAGDTVLTSAFQDDWPNAPHRVLRNRTVDLWEAAGRPSQGNRPGDGEQVALRDGVTVLRYNGAQPTGSAVGDVAEMALYAGTSCERVSAVEDASAIVSRLAQGTLSA